MAVDEQSPSRISEFTAGIVAELPLLLGVFPFGMIYGVLALQAGIPMLPAQLMSSILFAGSSQFVAAQMIGQGTPALVVIGTIVIVNLRHALYSASIAPHTVRLKSWWKALLAYLLTDEAYVVAINRYDRGGATKHAHWYFLGAGVTLWTCWQISTALGIFLGARLPEGLSLGFTLVLTFIALVVPLIKDRSTLLAAISAGILAIVAYDLPLKLSIVVAALAGIFIGVFVERQWARSGS